MTTTEAQDARPARPPRRVKAEVNGWLVLDKPVGMTSTQAVSRLKHMFTANKAGHAGTLDPLASGLLPIAFGEGVPVPVRLTFRQMPPERVPRNELSQALGHANAGTGEVDFVRGVVERWRGASMSGRPRQEDAEAEAESPDLRLLRNRLDSSLFRSTPPSAG